MSDPYLLLAVAAIAFVGWLDKRASDKRMHRVVNILLMHKDQLEKLEKGRSR